MSAVSCAYVSRISPSLPIAGAPEATLNIITRHRFTQPGTYYVALKVASSREGLLSPFGQVENLDRVRVVVHPATH